MSKTEKLKKRLKENLAKNMRFMDTLVEEMFQEAKQEGLCLDEKVQTIVENLRTVWLYGHESITISPHFGSNLKVQFGTEEQVAQIDQKIDKLIREYLNGKQKVKLHKRKDFKKLVDFVLNELDAWTTIVEIQPQSFIKRIQMILTLNGLLSRRKKGKQ